MAAPSDISPSPSPMDCRVSPHPLIHFPPSIGMGSLFRRRGPKPPRDEHSEPSASKEGPSSTPGPSPPSYEASVFDAWMASRQTSADDDSVLASGSPRSLTLQNVRIAIHIARTCSGQMLRLIWGSHPFRMVLLLALNVGRGALSTFRYYSHARILDEVRISYLIMDSRDPP